MDRYFLELHYNGMAYIHLCRTNVSHPDTSLVKRGKWNLMPVIVMLYSVYVPGEGVKLFTRFVEAQRHKNQRQAVSLQPVWGVGKHEIEVVNCVEVPDSNGKDNA